MIVGVIGGIGAGKSTVTRLFAELGAETVDADALAHEALETPSVKQSIVEWLGRDAISRDGTVDRKVIANLVFSSPEKLKKLESLVHPEVLRRIEEKVDSHERRGPEGSVLVLDVPLLLDTPLQRRCQQLVFVEASPQARERRVEIRGWTPGDLQLRESAQTAVEEKKRLADHIIDNSKSLEETRIQARSLYTRWIALSKKEGSA